MYFVIGHGTELPERTFVPAGSRLLLYAPPGHNLDFTVGLAVVSAPESSQAVEDVTGPRGGIPNYRLRALENLERSSAVIASRVPPARLYIVGRNLDTGTRLCTRPDLCSAAAGVHDEECRGLFRLLPRTEIHGIWCRGVDAGSPFFDEYNGRRELTEAVDAEKLLLIGLVDDGRYLDALARLAVHPPTTGEMLLASPAVAERIAAARRVAASRVPPGAPAHSGWWDPLWTEAVDRRHVPELGLLATGLADDTWRIAFTSWCGYRAVDARDVDLIALLGQLAEAAESTDPISRLTVDARLLDHLEHHGDPTGLLDPYVTATTAARVPDGKLEALDAQVAELQDTLFDDLLAALGGIHARFAVEVAQVS